MKILEIGKYEKASICDSGCMFKFEIIRRTEKNVWISSEGQKPVRKKVYVHDGVEFIYPSGKHSFCTVLRPEDRIEETKTELSEIDKKSVLEKLTISECNESIDLLKEAIEKIEKDSPEEFIGMKGEYLKGIHHYELAIELLKNRNDIRNQIQEKVNQASFDGKEACKQGKQGVPAFDSDLMKVISELTPEEQKQDASIKIIKAWSAGWTIQNLKD